MPEHAKISADRMFAPTAPMLSAGQNMMFALGRLQARNVKSMLHFQVELFDFFKRRCEQDMKLVDDLVASEDLSGAFVVYTGFCENAVSDYSKEAGKISEIGSRLAAESVRQVRAETRTVADDMAARGAA